VSNGSGASSPPGPASNLAATPLAAPAPAEVAPPAGEPLLERLRSLGHREAVVFPERRDSFIAQLHGAGFRGLGGECESSCAMTGWTEEIGVLLCAVSGRGRLRSADGDLAIAAGQALLLHCRDGAAYRLAADEPWEFFYLALAGREALRFLDEITDRASSVVTLEPRGPGATRAAQACIEALERRLDSPFRGSELAYAVLMAILAEVEARVAARVPAPAVVPSFLSKVEAFCQSHLERGIHVEQMARVANLSRFHFSREFRKACGLSPAQYLLRLRLEKAIALLRTQDCTLADIARECGFKDASYFCLVFRKRFGTTPGKFRRRGRLT
jgi:AraC family transcriptional regulator